MHRPKTPLITVIIPVYNEARRVTRGLRLALDFLSQQPYEWELIVVDDGSVDTTALLIERFLRAVKHHSRVWLLRTHTNFGKGHALRVGIAAASGRYIFFTDIDLSVPLTFIPQFLTALESHDVVIGSRRLRGSKVTQPQHAIRRSLGHGFTKLSNLVLGLNHTDYTCGFKAFRREVAQKLFNKLRANRWAFDAEILYLAHQHKYSVKEIPVTWKNDPSTKVSLTTDILQSAFDLLRIRF